MAKLTRLLAWLTRVPRCPGGVVVKGKCVKLDKRRVTLFTIGYILSPLSFWNDAFVNIPISYVAALLASMLLGPGIFPLAFFTAYLVSNIVGLLMMHIAVRGGVERSTRGLIEMLAAATLYTILASMLFEASLPAQQSP